MKVDRDKIKELTLAICSTYKLSYWEFIRPSKSPEYVKLRSIFIYFLKQHGMTQSEIAHYVNLDQSNVSRSYRYAKTKLLTSKKGMAVLKEIQTLVFRQSIGVGTAFHQITIQRVISVNKT